MNNKVSPAYALISNFLQGIRKTIGPPISSKRHLTVTKSRNYVVIFPNWTLLSVEQKLGACDVPVRRR